ncbi:MAG: AmmeMemoRadiSam system protein A [Planctomycetota bacterium]|nr:AmmeMemoRadiSam system protein A [Planctomycetota bacterium]
MIGEQTPQLLSKTQQDELLELARASLSAFLSGSEKEHSPLGFLKQGVFVTLRHRGQLRGCIGHALPRLRLDEAIWRLVRSAAQDQRFDPVQESEEAEISIELSVLTPLQKVNNHMSIEIGRHGLMVRQGLKSGLLLPKVASERGWDRETFLSATCQKAGLPSTPWKDADLEIYSFQCQVFSEETSQ